jgi:predicted transposase YbfD/YdcC
MIPAANILTYLEMIPDPRTFRLKHRLIDVVAIAILSKVCGADGWEDMQEFAQSRKEWLESFMELPGGVPSPDTFRRVLSNVNPSAFLDAFLEWMKAVHNVVPSLVSIDGKTLRSAAKHGENPIHIVSAWCEKNRMILGQVRNKAKSNEIAAIPELLKQLTLPPECIISIDAAGTQKTIASQIRSMSADYVLALKGNQRMLHAEVENYFLQAEEAGKEYAPLDEYVKEEAGHGRIEYRRVFATDDLEWLDQKSQWKDLRSIVRVESMRQIGEKREQENRYYISSLPPNAEALGKSIRGHWGVENSCHWTLDVVFKEDESLITEGNAPENLRGINLLVAKMLKAEKTCKKGIRAKQFKASLNHEYLCSVLQAANF